MLSFHQTVVFIGLMVLIVALVFSFSIRKLNFIPFSIKNFYVVPLLGLILTFNTILMNVLNSYSLEMGGMIERIIVMIDFLFWIYFFSSLDIKIFTKKSYESLILLGGGIVFIIISINYISNKFHHYTLAIFYFSEFIFCLTYLNRLFSKPPQRLLIKDPVFWIVTGLLLKCAVAIPTHLASEIMFVGKNSRFYFLIFPISNIAAIVMYLQFIYAFKCLKDEKLEEIKLNYKN
jgi:hypothetical protein